MDNLPFTTQGDVGRSGAFVMAAFNPSGGTSGVVYLTGPTQFDQDGYFTAGVYSVDLQTKVIGRPCVSDNRRTFICQ